MYVTINDLIKTYRRRGKIHEVFSHQTLEIQPGKFIAIVGRSGSGKTTFLHLLAGILAPSSGEIRYDGRLISDLSEKEQALFRNEKIGFIPQGNCLLNNFTVLDNVRLPLYLKKQSHQVAKELAEVERLLKKLNLHDLADEYPKNLSGGEQRRVMIARALIQKPKFILADEPTNDLDDLTKSEVLNLFKSVNQTGASIVMATHYKENLAAVDEIIQMTPTEA
ncbi:MAG: ABC transporter ATP-binding protein [Streptococcaceae bacterium]|jgi:putative ABC transport system ATP-binding protein|nr:ABC transporter ATP-binding protein [Streptococcaceae bacterium]